MQNRISEKFSELAKKGEGALICYVVAGYPDTRTSKQIINALVKGGADIIEIGIPFSDPIADGPTIQAASNMALSKGMTPEKALQSCKKCQKAASKPSFGCNDLFKHPCPGGHGKIHGTVQAKWTRRVYLARHAG